MSLPWQTKRLVLRRFELTDAAALAAYRSIAEIAKFQSWDAPYALLDAEELITSAISTPLGAQNEWLQIAVELTETGQLIGDCALRINARPISTATIGFTLDKQFQGKGYASEMVLRLMCYLVDELGIRRILADCDTRNNRSIQLLERLGFERMPHSAKSLYKGEMCEEYFYEFYAPKKL